MFELYLRPFYQRLMVDPIGRALSKILFITPIHITILGCLIGVASAYFIAEGEVILSILFLLLSGFFDTLDGTLARAQEKTSDFGSVLDIICDRIVEFAIVMGLFYQYQIAECSLYMLGSMLICITSFLVVGIFSENSSHKGFHYSPGLIERGEAFLFFVMMISFPSLFSILAYLFSALVFLTAIIRLYQFYRISTRIS